uniref:Uncharacterized protein n=1 Tax=Anguilla anguilla TaxID=7936 RepID=A0A0E9SAQ5_ANGAN
MSSVHCTVAFVWLLNLIIKCGHFLFLLLLYFVL